jgi:glycosyltransferase involved in cell wall biosynthesis
VSGVVFIISKSEVGGAQKWVKEQIEMLSISTTDPIYLVTDDCAGWLVEEVKDFCQDVFCDPAFSKGFSINTFYRLLRFSKKHQVKVIVASSAFAGVYARLLKIFIHIKVIYVSHGWSSIYRGKTLGLIYTFIERVLSLFTDVILCVSNSDYKAAQDIIKISEKKLTLIENKLFSISQKGNRSRGFSEPPKLLCVSRLDFPKRFDLCIRAVAGKNCELHIVGDGSQMRKLQRMASGLDNVIFEGMQQGFCRYSDYDVFLLASDSEGLPMSALEAMSAGLPLILSNVGGCSELIQDNGALFGNTEEELSRSIDFVLLNIENMSLASRVLFSQRFDLNVHRDQYIDLYYGE